MSYIILPSRRLRQPAGGFRINATGVNSGAKIVVCGTTAATLGTQYASPSVSLNYGIGATPDGIGYAFDASFASFSSFVQFTTDLVLSAGSACSIEFIVYGSSFPSLASLASLSTNSTQAVSGAVTGASQSIRGTLAFQGSNP
jgi:hypothetical protein